MRSALLTILMLLLPIMGLPAHAQALATANTTTAAIDPEVESITRRLLKAMSIAETTLKLMRTQMSELVQMLENGPNRMTDRAIDTIVEEMQKVAPQAIDEIVDAVVALYVERFTKQEMQEIAAFYETPVGKKAIRELTPLMLEASKIGQTIGQRLGQDAGQRAFTRIQAEGIKIRQT